MIFNLNDDLKKILLMGIGAVTTTAEKSKEMVDSLVEKGELTVEQGKVLNEELKTARVANAISGSKKKFKQCKRKF